jgi:hypothetical protein
VSEPEVRNVVSFITSHPNITGAASFHTWHGALLRPYSDRDDGAFPETDLEVYKRIGGRGSDITGYTHGSSYEEWGTGSRKGSQTSWLYDHLGIFAWTVELWNPYKTAGIENFHFGSWHRDHPLEDELKLLEWSDETLGGEGYVDWYPADHPQLGHVELGGWDWENFISNPPHALLEETVKPFPEWLVWHLLISPELEILHAESVPVGDGVYRVFVVAANTGWLPTQVTEMAERKNVVQDLVFTIHLPDGASIEGGSKRVEAGQLKGRSHKMKYLGTSLGMDPTSDRATAEWMVRASSGMKITVTARHHRAGSAKTALVLD